MTDVEKLVNRLRTLGSGCVGTISSHHLPLLCEAADQLERLAKLEAAARDVVADFYGVSDNISFNKQSARIERLAEILAGSSPALGTEEGE